MALPVFLAAMAAMMLPSEIALFRLDFATARSPIHTTSLAAGYVAVWTRVLHGWRDGTAGAFRMGLENGLWCAGCCVGAMVVLLAVGMMSVAWMSVVGAFVFVEKTL